MEQNTQTPMNEPESFKSGMIHFVLSHSYMAFLGAVILGVIFDVFIPIKIFNMAVYQYGGLGMLLLGSLLIYWAQSTSHSSKKEAGGSGSERDFERGPYKYSRNPTHIGLSVLTLGLAFLLNSPFSILFTVFASILSKFFFLKEEEALLEKKYGQPYRDYKNKVRTWV